MRYAQVIAVAVAIFCVGNALAGETVGVSGSNVQYPTETQAAIGDKKYPQKLTGAAMRKKAIINVYTVGSYVSTEFVGKSPDELACCDHVKQLHLVLVRDVSGSDMAKAFEGAIRANYPNDFTEELKKLNGLIQNNDTNKGDQVWITHIPGYGLHVNLVGKKSEYIPGVKFSKAVWEIYLGPKNIGEAVKKALVSRL